MATGARTTKISRLHGWGAVIKQTLIALGIAMGSLSAFAGEGPVLSPATTMAEAGMVDIRTRVPDIDQEIRYFGAHNFVGKPVDGYLAPRCYLQAAVADALAKVEAQLRTRNQRLRLYDCYRPARAVTHFVRWMDDPSDLATKAEFYPDLNKSQLRGVYIAPVSGHSRGGTVDLTLLQCDQDNASCTPLDMGTPFDFFGTRAHTDSNEVTPAQRGNRHLLRDAMQAQGFVNLPEEWWHFTLKPEPSATTYYDVPVTAFAEGVPHAAIDRLMQRYAGEGPGASLLVLKDGQPVIAQGYGRSDLGTGVMADTKTAYRLASVSKQFTAAAVLLLVQDGVLTLHDPVRKWLPSLPESTQGITLQHLLTHTSGLIDYEDLMAANYAGQITDAGVLALLENEQRLYFPPGTGYRYSNGAYALLALIVAKASAKTYPDFLRARIFQPLGMRNTLAYVKGGPPVPHRAWGYSVQDGHWEKTDQSSTSAVLGDGGIYSTIDDLARWDAALYDDRLLSDGLRAQMFTPHVTVVGEPYQASYGFGWRITGDSVWHSGETVGFRNVILRYPAQRLTVILLSNRNDPEPYPTALAIAALFKSE